METEPAGELLIKTPGNVAERLAMSELAFGLWQCLLRMEAKVGLSVSSVAGNRI